MRIIGGSAGGRRIHPPSKMPNTRPTTDIAKEGLFNILQHQVDFEGMKTLDLFGGTGSISYELASRGASDVTVVEKDPAMYEFIKKTAITLQFKNFNVLKLDVFRFLQQCRQQFDFIFAGPPYALPNIEDIPKLIAEKGLLKPGGLFVLEHTPRNSFEKFPLFKSERNYGTTVFSFFLKDEGHE